MRMNFYITSRSLNSESKAQTTIYSRRFEGKSDSDLTLRSQKAEKELYMKKELYRLILRERKTNDGHL